MCCMWLAENTGRKNDAKNRRQGTIPQLCWAISSQLRHVSTIGKKLFKQQYLIHMCPQYGELRPSSGWDRFGSLGHPSYFQRLPHLGSVTARHVAEALAKVCGIEQRAPTMFGRATITLGIGPHSSGCWCFMAIMRLNNCTLTVSQSLNILTVSRSHLNLILNVLARLVLLPVSWNVTLMCHAFEWYLSLILSQPNADCLGRCNVVLMLTLISYCFLIGSMLLNEGDYVTFGHMFGQTIKPGTRVRQPDSEYQFVVSFWLLLLYDC